MVLRHVGAERVQAFVDSLGLRQTQIPTSGRQFIGYIMGLPNWKETTWEDLQAGKFPAPRPILNDTITMASSAADLVSFYSRALTGEIFARAATLKTFRATLAMADAVPMAIPLGANGFGKGGEVSASGQHALTFAGGMYIPDRWVYFALLLNWTDDDGAAADIEEAYMEAVVQIFRLVRDRLSM
jgi:beta-lactamase class A